MRLSHIFLICVSQLRLSGLVVSTGSFVSSLQEGGGKLLLSALCCGRSLTQSGSWNQIVLKICIWGFSVFPHYEKNTPGGKLILEVYRYIVPKTRNPTYGKLGSHSLDVKNKSPAASCDKLQCSYILVAHMTSCLPFTLPRPSPRAFRKPLQLDIAYSETGGSGTRALQGPEPWPGSVYFSWAWAGPGWTWGESHMLSS